MAADNKAHAGAANTLQTDAIQQQPNGGASAVVPVVAIGASAGGLEAFTQLLHALPADTGMALVYIQHRDRTHASMLTELVGRATSLPVREIADGVPIEANHIYLNPPGAQVTMRDGALYLTPRDERPLPDRSIDHFFRSLAADRGNQAIAVVLSGTATDGTLGIQEIKAQGGITFAQDESARHDGMPRSAIDTGLVDFVLPPNAIAVEIARIASHPYVSNKQPQLPTAVDLSPVLRILHKRLGVDFSQYKRPTLLRRIARRMAVHKVDRLSDYANLLQQTPAEIEKLYQDILINVTSFFRDPEAFEVLKGKIFPKVAHGHSKNNPARMWVLGCSTGEEAYSLAMSFAEFKADVGHDIPVQIFATDLNEKGIERARSGIYPKNIAQDVSAQRLRRFFSEMDGSYRVNKAIREICVFARHNVLQEPPFSHMDLIACRNMLIYLDSELQEQVLPIMHYALRPGGHLWLGASETIGAAHRDLFEREDAKHRIYSRKSARARLPLPSYNGANRTFRGAGPSEEHPRVPPALIVDPLKEAERLLLTKFAPPSVLVNDGFDILQFRGDTGTYLTPAPGRATLNLLKMLRHGLLVGVRSALEKARRTQAPVRAPGMRVKSNGGYRSVDIEVLPIASGGPSPQSYLVLFQDPVMGLPATGSTTSAAADPPRAAPADAEIDAEVVTLRQELTATREYLQSVIEEQEAANEELQSANEEIQSANEELQSVNEELETSREEIQSSNEELATVNEELQHRNTELTQTNNDLLNLLGSVDMAIVMLGPDLKIRRFTPAAEKVMNLIPADIGRPIRHLNLPIEIEHLENILEEVIGKVSVIEREVCDKQGHWYLLRLRPYRTMENKIEGVVLILIDIDAIKRNEETMRRQAELLDQTFEPILMWDLDGRIVYWNRGAEECYGYERSQALGRRVDDMLRSSLSLDHLKHTLEQDSKWTGELTLHDQTGNAVEVESRMVVVRDPAGNAVVIQTDRPISERKRMESALRQRADELIQADQAKNEFLAMLAHELRNPLAPLRNAAEIFEHVKGTQPGLDHLQEMIGRQVHTMARLVDDLLDVARITGRDVELRKTVIDLRTLIDDSVELVQPSIEARRQTLSITRPDVPVHVDADGVRLAQAFGNLLNNASKFTQEGGQIWVGMQAEAPPSEPSDMRGRATVTIRDNGRGMAADLLPRIFDVFTQADRSLDRAQGGLGIGLSLARRLIKLHGGTIDVSSAGPGQGSEFIVRLPIVPAEYVQPAETRAQTQQSRPRNILIVDDNVDSATSFKMLLEMEGHQVSIAHEGHTALDMARAVSPEIIVLDIGLPGMDGYEVARQIRSSPDLQGIYVVALSGYGYEAHRRAAQEAGFDQYLIKPLDHDAFRELLNTTPHRPRPTG